MGSVIHLAVGRLEIDRPWGEALKEKGRALSGPALSHLVAKLLLDLRLPRRRRRPIAFTKALAASPIAPLDETRSQVGAPAIAANQLVCFRLAAPLFAERP